jgi:hypothetical protein
MCLPSFLLFSMTAGKPPCANARVNPQANAFDQENTRPVMRVEECPLQV